MENDPLEELLVVELANVLAGPAVGMFFAELGARVIKVENPRTGGDVTRSWRMPDEGPDSPGAYFTAVNWGKQSVAVDLATAKGQAVVHDLIERADVALCSYKPGDAERLGVDWRTLSAVNPRLIYAEISAYGEGSARVGYDAVLQAEVGFTSMNGTETSGPLKMPVALMDLLAGHQVKEGVLAALIRRERSGRGARVRVSLFESGIAALANQAANTLMTGNVPRRMGSGHPNIAPYGTVYRCHDGAYIVLAVGTDEQFRKLAVCLSDPRLGRDRRFKANVDRVRNRAALEERLSERISAQDSGELMDRLEEHGVPAGRVRDVDAALGDPAARALVLGHRSGASAVRTRSFRIDDEPGKALSPPPTLSEHANPVLIDLLSYGEAAIDDLEREGVILRGRSEAADA